MLNNKLYDLYHVLPVVLSFGYIPVIIHFVSTSYFRGETFKDLEIPDDQKLEWDGLLFVFFCPQYMVCIFFVIFHLFTFFYKNIWTVAALHSIAVLMTLTAGAALYPVSHGYEHKDQKKEQRAMMAGIILLLLVQILGYSTWPFFARLKLKALNVQKEEYLLNRRKWYIIMGVSVVIACIGLVCYIGGLIATTSKTRDSLKSNKDSAPYMFDIVSEYLLLVLFPAMITTLVLFLKFGLRYKWMVYLVSSVVWLLIMFIGFASYGVLYRLALYNYLRTAANISWDDLSNRVPLDSLISEFIGGVIMTCGVVPLALSWPLIFWLDGIPADAEGKLSTLCC